MFIIIIIIIVIAHSDLSSDLEPSTPTESRPDQHFEPELSGCYAILTSPNEGETAVYGYNPALF